MHVLRYYAEYMNEKSNRLPLKDIIKRIISKIGKFKFRINFSNLYLFFFDILIFLRIVFYILLKKR